MPPGTIDAHFLQLANANIGIAHKVCRIYFRDPEDQADVLQEMMYQLWRSFEKFDNRSKFSTWMYSVCLNTALTFKRRSDRRRTAEMVLEHEQTADPVESDHEAAISALYSAIATLSPINRAIIMLYLEELSYDEIAQITGLSRSNVSVRLVRAKKELQKLMESS